MQTTREMLTEAIWDCYFRAFSSCEYGAKKLQAPSSMSVTIYPDGGVSHSISFGRNRNWIGYTPHRCTVWAMTVPSASEWDALKDGQDDKSMTEDEVIAACVWDAIEDEDIDIDGILQKVQEAFGEEDDQKKVVISKVIPPLSSSVRLVGGV